MTKKTKKTTRPKAAKPSKKTARPLEVAEVANIAAAMGQTLVSLGTACADAGAEFRDYVDRGGSVDLSVDARGITLRTRAPADGGAVEHLAPFAAGAVMRDLFERSKKNPAATPAQEPTGAPV